MNTTIGVASGKLAGDFSSIPDALGIPASVSTIADTLAWAREVVASAVPGSAPPPSAPKLPEPTMEFDSESMILLLQTLNHKISELQMDTAKQTILLKKDETDRTREENVKKIEEAQAKQKDAEKAQKKSWWTSLFKAIASVILSVVAVALAVVSFGAASAASVALICLSVYMAAQSVADLTAHIINKYREENGQEPIDLSLTSWIGKGVAKIAEECGASESTCRWIQMGVSVGIQIGLAVASIALSFKAAADVANAAEKAADSAGKILSATEKAAAVAENTSNACIKAMKIMSTVGGIVDAGLGIGDGVIKIEVAEKVRDARESQADAKLFDAIMMKLRQAMEEQQEEIKKLIRALEESDSIISQIIAGASDSRALTIRNMA